MKRIGLWAVILIAIGACIVVCPEFALAQFSGGLQAKVQGVTNGLIDFLLPTAACLGLVYAAILAAIGDASAKQRMVLILVASAVGMLAPFIIHWIQGMTR